jgi:hypothetical protein
MTPDHIIILIEHKLASFPDRISGNEGNRIVADDLRSLAEGDRGDLLSALRQYLSFRMSPSQRKSQHAVPKARLWLALEVAEQLGLAELTPDIELLAGAVRRGAVLLPVHEKMIRRYLHRIKVATG